MRRVDTGTGNGAFLMGEMAKSYKSIAEFIMEFMIWQN
jgi:hypothetical protein